MSIIKEKSIYEAIKNLPLYFDSRKATVGGVFFALAGKQDGHNFVHDAIEKGVKYCFVKKNALSKAFFEQYPHIHFFECENPLYELQKLAINHRNLFDIPIVGVTGSNGKTIVKEWLYQMLCKKFFVVKSPKSYNSQVGVPLSVWQLRKENDIAIFEAGISQPNEMDKLAQIIRPTMGIFTNLGSAHDVNFESLAQKFREKWQLFAHAEFVLMRENLFQQYKNLLSEAEKSKIVLWGESAICRFIVQSFPKLQDEKLHFSHGVILDTKENLVYEFDLPFLDAASIENALQCVLLILHQKWLSQIQIQQALWQLSAIEMRLQCRYGVDNSLIIDDTYNNDFAGLEVAIDFMLLNVSNRKTCVIISDMAQTNAQTDSNAEEIENLLRKKGINRAIIISKKQNFRFKKIPTIVFDVVEDFEKAFLAKKIHFTDEGILIKGGRNYQFEKIVELLHIPNHGAVLEVNLSSIKHNLQYFRSLLAPQTALMCMVKASAYGSSYEIAHLLAYFRVEYLGVAYADEAIALREAGIKLPIMVMNTSPENYAQVLDFGLEVSIFSVEILRNIGAFLKEKKAKLRVHLEFDTGMKRLGFEQSHLPELCTLLDEYQDFIEIAACFTHLAGTDSPELDDFTHLQVQQFLFDVAFLEEKMGKKLKKHVLNSAGIARFQAYHFDMVRLGVGLYGIETVSEMRQHLLPVGTLKASISQIRTVKAGESIGYSRKFIASQEMLLGTIAIGYADGYSRRFSNGVGYVWFQNKACPVVGNVCMDMCMVDLSGTQPRVGDKVVIFGENPTVEQLADKIGTIAYEILAQIGSRVKRIFYEE